MPSNRVWFHVVLLVLVTASTAVTPHTVIGQALNRTMALKHVVMILADGRPGAGIVIGHDDRYVYVATANHVVRPADGSADPYDDVTVAFYDDQETWLPASVHLQHVDPERDLALVQVPTEPVKDRAPDSLLDLRVADGKVLTFGDAVFPCGQGAARAWWHMSEPGRFYAYEEPLVSIDTGQSGTWRGASGGAMFDEQWRVVAMTQQRRSGGRLYGLEIGLVLQFFADRGVPITATGHVPNIPREVTGDSDANDGFASASWIDLAQGVDGRVGNTDPVDWYRFRIEEHGTLGFKLINRHPVRRTTNGRVGAAYLHDENQNELAWVGKGGRKVNPAKESAVKTVPVSAGRDYFVKIGAVENHAAPYRLELSFVALNQSDIGEPNDSSQDAMEFSFGESLVATVGFGKDREDWYRIVPNHSGSVTLTVTNLHQNAKLVLGKLGPVEIKDDSGRTVARVSGGGSGTKPTKIKVGRPFAVEAGRTYHVRARGIDERHAVPYRLQLSSVR